MIHTTDHAIVLGRVDYGEKDRIVTLLCKQQGRQAVLAKGVRAAKSKLAGGIELFSETEITTVRTKSSLATLTSSRLTHYYGNIVQDMGRTNRAYYVLKTINKITHDDSGQEYYDVLRLTLAGLNNLTIDESIIQLWFELQLLKLSGSIPNLQTDTHGQPLRAGVRYSFDYDEQAFYQDDHGNFRTDHIKLLRLCESSDAVPNVRAASDIEQQVATLSARLLTLYTQ